MSEQLQSKLLAEALVNDGEKEIADTLKAEQLQGREVNPSFPNVNPDWLSGCISIDKAREELANVEKYNRDLRAKIGPDDMRLALDDNEILVMTDGDTVYNITDLALRKLSSQPHFAQTASNFLLTGFKPATKEVKGEQQILYNPTREDKQNLVDVFNNRLFGVVSSRSESSGNEFMFKLHDPKQMGGRPTINGTLTPKHLRIPTDWLMETIGELVGNGSLVSHMEFRNQGYSCQFNLLVPQGNLADDQSELSGMVMVRNCDIGFWKFHTIPAFYRFICQNGCIWDVTKGKLKTTRKHLGKADQTFEDIKDYFEIDLKKVIQEQLGIAKEGQVRFVESASDTFDVSWEVMLAQLSNAHKLDAPTATPILKMVGEGSHDDSVFTRQNLINVVTQTAHCDKFKGTDTQHELELLGGRILALDSDKFATMVSKASKLTTEDVHKVFPVVAG